MFRQQVPRPKNAVVEDGLPWESDGGISISISALRSRFATLEVGDVDASVVSAVLAPVFDRDGDARVVLIRRALGLARDPGHIALPGGRLEPTETPIAAALRESEEEIGLRRADFDVVAPLPIARRHSDRQVVAPFLGILRAAPTYVVNPDEVDAVFDVSLSALAAKGVAWREEWEVGGVTRRLPFFASFELLGDDLIWGLTAGILWDLITRVLVGDSAGE